MENHIVNLPDRIAISIQQNIPDDFGGYQHAKWIIGKEIWANVKVIGWQDALKYLAIKDQATNAMLKKIIYRIAIRQNIEISDYCRFIYQGYFLQVISQNISNDKNYQQFIVYHTKEKCNV